MTSKKRLCEFLLNVFGNECRKEFNEQQVAYQKGEPYTRTWKTVLAAQERGLKTMSDVYRNLGTEPTALEFAEIIKEISENDYPLDCVMTFAEATEELGCATGYLNSLVKRGALKEGEDFRKAGRVCLITRKTVDRLKNNSN